MSKVYAIIVAGGLGTRVGTAIPKQFLMLDNKPVLYYSLRAFIEAIPGIQLILVLPESYISYAQIVLQSFPKRIDLTITTGGATRFQSVQNGLKHIQDDSIVFIHDGARPLISKTLIKNCYKQAMEKGSAIPALAATDSMRIIINDGSKPVNRNQIKIIQTPQTFRASILLPAMQQDYQEGFTDEATAVEFYGEKVFLIAGEKKNIKITTPEDLIIAETLLKTEGL